MSNFANGTDIPMGFGMALAQNLSAMNYFSTLPRARQQQILQRTYGIHSKEEMQSFVASLSNEG